MYRHILIATDGSEIADRAVEHGVSLAKSLGAKVTLVTVTGPPPGMAHPQVAAHIPEIMRQVAKVAEHHLATARAIAERLGMAADTVHVENEQPYEGIIETAHNRGADLVVIGSHGWGALKSLLLGSVTLKVLTHCTVPVLVHRDPRK